MANCENCGAEKVKNPKTGKMFCSKKCWLNPTQKFKEELKQDDRELGQAWGNAKTNAVSIVLSQPFVSEQQTKTDIQKWAGFIFNMRMPR